MVAKRVAAVEVPFSNLPLTDKLGGHRWARLAGYSSKGSKGRASSTDRTPATEDRQSRYACNGAAA